MDDETPFLSSFISIIIIILLIFFYSVVAEWNCLLLVSCLDKSYIVLQVWLLRFVRVVPYL